MTTVGSGNRYVASGALASEGSHGYYWSASPDSPSHGLLISFNSGYVATQGLSHRGNGFPLRCIREFTLHGENRWNGWKRKRRKQDEV